MALKPRNVPTILGPMETGLTNDWCINQITNFIFTCPWVPPVFYTHLCHRQTHWQMTDNSYLFKSSPSFLYSSLSQTLGERGGSEVECRTPEREVGGSKPTAAMLCPWARHFTPWKYWLITQEAVAPSRHDWKFVDWDVKPQHKQINCHRQTHWQMTDNSYLSMSSQFSTLIFVTDRHTDRWQTIVTCSWVPPVFYTHLCHRQTHWQMTDNSYLSMSSPSFLHSSLSQTDTLTDDRQ